MLERNKDGEAQGRSLRMVHLVKMAVFLALCAVLVGALSVLFEPFNVGHSTNNDTVKGIYAQPAGSVQVAAFGTSTVHAAFSPMELYERNGVGAYNCATSVQSMITSYYLLEDLVRLQGGDLKVAVVDPTSVIMPVSDARKQAQAERVISGMDLSAVKLDAIFAASKFFSGYDLLEHLIPVFAYHSRWNELSSGDFELLFGSQGVYYSRGQYIRYLANVERSGSKRVTSKANAGITASCDYPEDELEALWVAKEKDYLDRFASFCRDNGVSLLFVKTPRTDWGDLQHDSAALLARAYDAPFLDFSTEDMMAELDLSYDYDFVDKKHANARGAKKITTYLGSYLISHYELDDLRENDAFDGLKENAGLYDEAMRDAQLMLVKDLGAYLDAVDDARYTVFIASCGNAAKGLSGEIRDRLTDMGFSGIAQLDEGGSCVGVRDGGKVVVDVVSEGSSDSVRATGVYDGSRVNVTKKRMQPGASLANTYTLTGSGPQDAESVEINVLGSNRAEGGEGLNFVVYNSKTHELVDTSCFATGVDCARVSDIL